MNRIRGRSSTLVLTLVALIAIVVVIWALLESSPEAPPSKIGVGATPHVTRPTQLETDPLSGDATTPAGVAPAPSGAIEIYGRVTNVDGQALQRKSFVGADEDHAAANARKPLIRVMARVAGHSPVIGKVDAEGNYTIPHVAAGTWIVSASALDRERAEVTLVVDGSEARVRHDFQLDDQPMLVVRVMVRGAEIENQRVPGVRGDALATRFFLDGVMLVTTMPPVQATDPYVADQASIRSEDKLRAFEKHGPDWSFQNRFSVAWVGTYYVSLILRGEIVETRQATDLHEPIVFEVDAMKYAAHFATLNLRVVDRGTQSPLGSVEVEARRGTKRVEGDEDDAMLMRGATDSNGELVLPFLAPGRVEVDLRLPEYETMVLEATLTAGAITDLGTTQLGNPVVVRGKVIGPGGEVLATRVECVPDGAKASGLAGFDGVRASSTADGFEFRTLGRRKYIVRLSQPNTWAAEPVVIDTSGGSLDGIALVASKGAMTSLSIESSREAGFDVYIVDAHDLPLTEGLRTGGTGQTIALLPGKYKAIAHSDGQVIAEQVFEVGTEASTVTVKVP